MNTGDSVLVWPDCMPPFAATVIMSDGECDGAACVVVESVDTGERYICAPGIVTEPTGALMARIGTGARIAAQWGRA